MPSIRKLAVLCFLLGADVAVAQTFDTGPATGPLTGSGVVGGGGVGQAVTVSSSQTVTNFGFYIGVGLANTGLKFQIRNAANNAVLFEQVRTVGPIAATTLVSTDPMAFALTAGSLYNFALISDAQIIVRFFDPTITLAQNGLSISGPNANYAGFTTPAFTATGFVTLALQINTLPSTAVPEPTSIALTLVGLSGIAAAARRTRRQA